MVTKDHDYSWNAFHIIIGCYNHVIAYSLQYCMINVLGNQLFEPVNRKKLSERICLTSLFVWGSGLQVIMLNNVPFLAQTDCFVS